VPLEHPGGACRVGTQQRCQRSVREMLGEDGEVVVALEQAQY
jgi:hypothetical protein